MRLNPGIASSSPRELPGCGHDAADLVLFHYGELTGPDAARVADRVAGCEPCREELARLVEWAARTRLAVAEPDPDRAADARAAALVRIGRRSMRVWIRRAIDLVAGAGAGVPRLAGALAVGVVLVAIGIAIGRVGTDPAATDGAGVGPAETGGVGSGLAAGGGEATLPVATGALEVRDIIHDPVTGEILIRYAVPVEASISGSLENASVARTLARALSESNDTRLRLHALRALNVSGAAPSAPDPDLVDAVLTILETGQADPLRLRAVEALGVLFSGAELTARARMALLDILRSNAGDAVRIAALDALVDRSLHPGDVDRLAEVARTDVNPYVRMQALGAVRRLGSAVPLESYP